MTIRHDKPSLNSVSTASELSPAERKPTAGRTGKLSFLYPLDPNALFEEIVLDPRLEDGEVKSLETELRAAGCGISIRQSDLYKVPEFIIPAMPT